MSDMGSASTEEFLCNKCFSPLVIEVHKYTSGMISVTLLCHNCQEAEEHEFEED